MINHRFGNMQYIDDSLNIIVYDCSAIDAKVMREMWMICLGVTRHNVICRR